MVLASIAAGIRRLLTRNRSEPPPTTDADNPALVSWPSRDGLWADVPDGQAVRNRVRMVKRTIEADLARRCPGGVGTVRILSMGAYSSAGTVVALAEFLRRHPRANVTLRVVDDRMPTLARLRTCAEAAGVSDRVELVRAPAASVLASEAERWDIFEMAGLLDTVPFHEGVRVLARVGRLAGSTGSVVTAQLGPSAWAPILRSLSRWPRLYRRPASDLARLLGTAGFSHSRIELSREPHGICAVAVHRPPA
jgi:hypothetical protein